MLIIIIKENIATFKLQCGLISKNTYYFISYSFISVLLIRYLPRKLGHKLWCEIKCLL